MTTADLALKWWQPISVLSWYLFFDEEEEETNKPMKMLSETKIETEKIINK